MFKNVCVGAKSWSPLQQMRYQLNAVRWQQGLDDNIYGILFKKKMRSKIQFIKKFEMIRDQIIVMRKKNKFNELLKFYIGVGRYFQKTKICSYIVVF